MRPRRIRDMTPKRMQGSRGKQSFPVPGPSDLTPAAALCNGQTLTEKGGPRVRMNVEVGLSEVGAHQKAGKGALLGKWGCSQGHGPEAGAAAGQGGQRARGRGQEDTGMDMGLEEASRGRSKWGFLTQGGREGQKCKSWRDS